MSLEIWSFVVDVLSLIATVVLTVAIYWLQRSHEKEREQMEVEAQKKAVAEAARVFLIDNEDEIECLPLSAIAKSLNLKRKHHRARITFHKNQSQAPASRCWRGLVHPAGLDKLRGVCYDFSSHNVFRCDVPPFSAGCGWPIAAASPTGNGSDGPA